MNEQERIQLESSIQDLQARKLGPTQTRELLARIASDAETRSVLSEMIELQSLSRRSFGVDVDDKVLRDGAAGVFEALGRMNVSDAATSVDKPRPGRKVPAMIRDMIRPARIAAAVLIGVCIYLAVMARNDSEFMKTQLSIMNKRISMPAATDAEVANLRQVWTEVSSGAESSRAWVFMSNGGGRFGYVPVNAVGGDRPGLILLRCAIVGSDGKRTKQMNLLLPAEKVLALDVMDAGSLVGSPVRISVSASGDWAGMDLEVGTQSDGVVGLKGRARLGAEATEVGQFRLNGREMKVFLHATRISRTVG
jgi:hypothetical protein